MVRLDLWAEIIPGVSAAGFSIGQHLSSIPDLSEPNLVVNLQEEREKREKGLKSININEALSKSDGWNCQKICSDSEKLDGHKVFYYKDRIVLLEFNSDDILFKIFVFEGYQGKFFDLNINKFKNHIFCKGTAMLCPYSMVYFRSQD